MNVYEVVIIICFVKICYNFIRVLVLYLRWMVRMSFISKFFKRGYDDSNAVVVEHSRVIEAEKIVPEEILELPEGELVSIVDGVLDVDSSVNVQKLKHNLQVLMEKAKRDGRIDKFMLIREDDYFPKDYEWQVSSKNTCMEQCCLALSIAVKKKIALDKAGVQTSLNGIPLPTDDKTVYEALKGVDKYLGAVYLPSHFRSTKHFTVNTPLGVTGDYNSVAIDRNFIVIDGIDNFLKSGFSYSVSYHDAYLDVTHKSLPVSEDAVILIEQGRYEKIKNDEEVMKQLKDRRVVIFKGDEVVAIDMVLTELGVLPSQIGMKYAYYDRELMDIMEQSIRDLASSNNLMFNKSHSGELTPTGGHFSNYFDDKNHDYDRSVDEFVEFLRLKFPEHKDLFTTRTVSGYGYAEGIVDKIGAEKLLVAIEEYNTLTMNNFHKRYEEYRKDRGSITPEIEEILRNTTRLIDRFYMTESRYDSVDERYTIEEQIRIFLQGDSVKEQLSAAKIIIEFINSKNISIDTELDSGTLKM